MGEALPRQPGLYATVRGVSRHSSPARAGPTAQRGLVRHGTRCAAVRKHGRTPRPPGPARTGTCLPAGSAWRQNDGCGRPDARRFVGTRRKDLYRLRGGQAAQRQHRRSRVGNRPKAACRAPATHYRDRRRHGQCDSGDFAAPCRRSTRQRLCVHRYLAGLPAASPAALRRITCRLHDGATRHLCGFSDCAVVAGGHRRRIKRHPCYCRPSQESRKLRVLAQEGRSSGPQRGDEHPRLRNPHFRTHRRLVACNRPGVARTTRARSAGPPVANTTGGGRLHQYPHGTRSGQRPAGDHHRRGGTAQRSQQRWPGYACEQSAVRRTQAETRHRGPSRGFRRLRPRIGYGARDHRSTGE